MTEPDFNASDADGIQSASQATPLEESAAILTIASVASVASVADPLAQVLDYTLTVGQARQRFLDLSRRAPAERTMQNYCVQGDVAAQKIRTTYGAEWIINATSLETFILRQPELTSVASDAHENDVAPHATQAKDSTNNPSPTTPAASVASDALRNPDLRPVGEFRNIVDVLIENARLLAQVEDRNEILADLRRERSFMQEQVRSSVKLSERALTQGDNLLRTLQVMRLGPGVILNDNQSPASSSGNSSTVDNTNFNDNSGL